MLYEKPTQEEIEAVMQSFFPSKDPLRMPVMPTKRRKQFVAFYIVSGCFTKGICYTEKEINAILEQINPDYATIRRSLIDYGLMERTPYGSSYWLKEEKAIETKER
ncbi:MAG TPA: DUF2087 domain-containing protein [Bacillota bacterium]|nr:DUF2087 domain-containing protein [Bacillota bacterium]HPF42556.1 DUF2087 domain-containing protein [Bacillota bacterium]HPJ85886.1 DUF2087 domain-containing protein [Bacillota bacterium]HPQ62176.1 DUF2087 domain-containing protein [Bacillota bacterium]HRX91584.1 DUF2087 domain-containing protein [Candidatus Izemoplasmatales bacterium]